MNSNRCLIVFLNILVSLTYELFAKIYITVKITSTSKEPHNLIKLTNKLYKMIPKKLKEIQSELIF